MEAIMRARLTHPRLVSVTGGYIVISHVGGRAAAVAAAAAAPADVPCHALPDDARLRALAAGLPLRLVSFIDEPALYCAVLQARWR